MKKKKIQVKTLNQITKINFELPEYNILDWFEVHLYNTGCLIKSGLRHADGITKSPYFYEKSFFGKSYKKEALKDFNLFLNRINEEGNNK